MSKYKTGNLYLDGEVVKFKEDPNGRYNIYCPDEAQEEDKGWMLGADTVRGDFEFADDTRKAVVFKKRDDGKFVVAKYPGRPYDQKEFEADMQRAMEYFYQVPILCEECGEIGKHKTTCSQYKKAVEVKLQPSYQSTPTKNAEEDKQDWEILTWCNKGGEPHEYHGKEKGGMTCEEMECEIHSVRRKSTNETFVLSEEIGLDGEWFTISKFEITKGSDFTDRMKVEFKEGFWIDFDRIKKLPTTQHPDKPVERIEVSGIVYRKKYPDPRMIDMEYIFETVGHKIIPSIKFHEIKKAIEEILNK